MSQIKIALVNGPPRAGKDTAVDCLKKLGFVEVKYSTPLKQAAVALTGITFEMLESQKDEPLYPLRSDKTFRDLQISLSEDCFRPLFGTDIFGYLLAQRILSHHNTTGATKFAVSDSGFKAESVPVVEQFGADNVIVLQAHRPGCDFSNDSREWVDLSDMGARTYAVHNDTTIEAYQNAVSALVTDAFADYESEVPYDILLEEGKSGHSNEENLYYLAREVSRGGRGRRVAHFIWDGPLGNRETNAAVVRERIAEMAAKVASHFENVHVQAVVATQKPSDPYDRTKKSRGKATVTFDRLPR